MTVDAVANSGGTAVMFAAGGGYADTVEYLIENKADVNVVVKATSEYQAGGGCRAIGG